MVGRRKLRLLVPPYGSDTDFFFWIFAEGGAEREGHDEREAIDPEDGGRLAIEDAHAGDGQLPDRPVGALALRETFGRWSGGVGRPAPNDVRRVHFRPRGGGGR